MSSEIITLIVSSLTATISAPLGAWLGAKLQSQKYKTEIDSLRAEGQKKLAGVKDWRTCARQTTFWSRVL